MTLAELPFDSFLNAFYSLVDKSDGKFTLKPGAKIPDVLTLLDTARQRGSDGFIRILEPLVFDEEVPTEATVFANTQRYGEIAPELTAGKPTRHETILNAVRLQGPYEPFSVKDIMFDVIGISEYTVEHYLVDSPPNCIQSQESPNDSNSEITWTPINQNIVSSSCINCKAGQGGSCVLLDAIGNRILAKAQKDRRLTPKVITKVQKPISPKATTGPEKHAKDVKPKGKVPQKPSPMTNVQVVDRPLYQIGEILDMTDSTTNQPQLVEIIRQSEPRVTAIKQVNEQTLTTNTQVAAANPNQLTQTVRRRKEPPTAAKPITQEQLENIEVDQNTMRKIPKIRVLLQKILIGIGVGKPFTVGNTIQGSLSVEDERLILRESVSRGTNIAIILSGFFFGSGAKKNCISEAGKLVVGRRPKGSGQWQDKTAKGLQILPKGEFSCSGCQWNPHCLIKEAFKNETI